jgi:hypothetical protein
MMHASKEQTPGEAQHRSLVVVWLVFVISQALFFAFCAVVSPDDDPGLIHTLRWPIAVLALTFIVDSFRWKRKFLLSEKLDRPSAINRAYITAFSLSEAAALFGVMLRFAAFRFYYVFFAAAAITTILHFPRKEHVLAAY